MTCFEITINGNVMCTAGVGKTGTLSSALTWVCRDPKNCPESADDKEWSKERMELFVFGIEAGNSHVSWLQYSPQNGDEITIKIIDRSLCDPPVLREQYENCELKNTFNEPNDKEIAVRCRDIDPKTGHSYEIHLSKIIKGETSWDDTVDVELVFFDGSRYVSRVCKDMKEGKGQQGSCFVDSKDIVVSELSTENILEAVKYFVNDRNLGPAFQRVGDLKAHAK